MQPETLPAARSPAEQAALNMGEAIVAPPPPARPSRVPVLFLAAAQDDLSGFNPGEVAGFDPHVAEKLVRSGAATYDLAAVDRIGKMDKKFAPEREFGALVTRKTQGTVTVEFIREFAPYFVGEIAGFSQTMADWLMKHGYAKTTAPKGIFRRTLETMRKAIVGA